MVLALSPNFIGTVVRIHMSNIYVLLSASLRNILLVLVHPVMYGGVKTFVLDLRFRFRSLLPGINGQFHFRWSISHLLRSLSMVLL